MLEACVRALPHLCAVHGRHGISRRANESLKGNCPRWWCAEGDGRAAFSIGTSGLGAAAHVEKCVAAGHGGFKASRQKFCRHRRGSHQPLSAVVNALQGPVQSPCGWQISTRGG